MAIEPSLPNTRILQVLGTRIDNLTRQEALGVLMRLLEDRTPRHVCFVNAHCVNTACVDASYRAVLQRADLALPDGVGVKLAARWTGETLRDNVNGTDLFPLLCGALRERGRSLYLLGARPGVVERVRAWVEEHHAGLRIAGTDHGYFLPDEEASVVRRIARSHADVLLVAMGVPMQEKWIDRHLPALGVRVAMGVGGLFDFYSSTIPRAPAWMRASGLEWLYRLYQEPGRMWRRYVLGNPLFIARMLRHRLPAP